MADLIHARVRAELSTRIGASRRTLGSLLASQSQLPWRSGDFLYRVRITALEDADVEGVDVRGNGLHDLLRRAVKRFKKQDPDTQYTTRVFVVLPRKAGEVELLREVWEPYLPEG
jgi:hypothetical protein